MEHSVALAATTGAAAAAVIDHSCLSPVGSLLGFRGLALRAVAAEAVAAAAAPLLCPARLWYAFVGLHTTQLFGGRL